MAIYFVRHGQTDDNLHGYLQGQSDTILNEEGKQQAEITKASLQGIHFDKVYCSPLKRARQTATIITYLPLHIDDRLTERNFGKWEGRHRSECEFASFWIPGELLSDGIEALSSLFDRVQSFIRDVEKEAEHNNILVVSHGGVSIPFVCNFEPKKQNLPFDSLIIHNCEVVKWEVKKVIQK